MTREGSVLLSAAVAVAVCAAPDVAAQEFYFDLDSTYAIAHSDSKIAVQFDTTITHLEQAEFLATHPCLDDTIPAEYLARGFWTYGLQPPWDYDSASAGLLADPAVHRVVPVYMTLLDSAEFKVTDMVSVQYDADLPTDSALAILDAFGLSFLDSSEFVHNLWHAALHDTIRGSPLNIGNELHLLPETEWASATMFARPVLMADTAPSDDPYFQYQYYLKNTGQNGGTPDADIDADLAWQLRLADSLVRVAVIDDGLIAHKDLRPPRLLPGRDFAGVHWWAPSYDNDPSPGDRENHGMACAGILAASDNDTGVVGVLPSCLIVPVKILDDSGNAMPYPNRVAEAIYYAWSQNVEVISNSWGYITTTPNTDVANAIRYVTNGCGGGQKDPQTQHGCVMVFSAGNNAHLGYTVQFPANMPEVIAVGAVDKSDDVWYYSQPGPALDLMAPSGDKYIGDMWTTDQEAYWGWNPYVTGFGDAGGDVDYTSKMGGTSGACPQVAGVAALILARRLDFRGCSPHAIVYDVLTKSAEDLGQVGHDNWYGFGRVNAYRALCSVIHGDMDVDGNYDMTDVVTLIGMVFRGQPFPSWYWGLADVNCDETFTVQDIVLLINTAFRGGSPSQPCYKWLSDL
ncbi:MAG: S8 family serine peptidase [Candidatus Zixiibacteriota bacterium]